MLIHRARRLALILGCVLLLGGAAHSVGVLHLYVATRGWPEPNRALLDAWIAEAQLVAGGLFVTATRSAQLLPWVLCGALVVSGYAVPFLPVLVHRAPPIFWIAPTVYSLLSAALLWQAAHCPNLVLSVNKIGR